MLTLTILRNIDIFMIRESRIRGQIVFSKRWYTCFGNSFGNMSNWIKWKDLVKINSLNVGVNYFTCL